jgi:hypothetical protein
MKNARRPVLAAALSALPFFLAMPVSAQEKDPKLVTCAELIAMDAAAQTRFVDSMIAASSDADNLDDLVADSATGPIVQVCQGNPAMLALEAAKSVQR